MKASQCSWKNTTSCSILSAVSEKTGHVLDVLQVAKWYLAVQSNVEQQDCPLLTIGIT